MTHAAAASRRSNHPFAYVAALFFVLLCLMPPTGKLSDNEENYFALAARAVALVRPSPDTAIFDASPHRFVNEFVLGHLIAAAGFETAQITARSVAALAYAIALSWLFYGIGLSALDAVLVVVVFVMMGQTLFGGEWLFGDYEAKIPAYALVIAGLACTLSRRSWALSALLFAAATYFHFLVGIFWFVAAIALRLVADRREGRRLLMAAALFMLAVAPLLALIASSRIRDGAVAAADMPSPDVIYSIIRAPHHTSPFVSWDNFVGQWLPGLLLAAAMLATTVVVARSETSQRLRPVARWLGGLLIYLFLAFAAAYLDRRTGMLGKLYLFRPASLLLLLWLAL
ncbi:MAG TPA: hypothetical protein VET85_04070, partial [Stellaceae bacterium]|nr:hypothetical protein [Stellaceae bacterium]